MNKGKLVVVSGPSGCGKGTVLKEVLKSRDNIFYSVSATTRKPREGEINGVHYFFITKEEFLSEIEAGGMLEYAEYVGNFYGTPKKKVEEELEKGNDVILEIETKGAEKIRKAVPEALFIFILPPSVEELASRLKGRGTESEEVIKERLETAKTELASKSEYDYIVINDEVKRASEEILEIINNSKN